jgi:hypothetical protein
MAYEAPDMGIREELNKRPAIAAGIVGGLILAAGAAWYALGGDSFGPAARAFYSVDDGASYFVDDADRIYPFDHGGKVAYRAYVFRNGDEKPVVGYLARYSDATKAKIAALQAKANDPEAKSQLAQVLSAEYEVRKPGTTNWAAAGTPEGGQVMRAPTSKDGKQTAIGVTP